MGIKTKPPNTKRPPGQTGKPRSSGSLAVVGPTVVDSTPQPTRPVPATFEDALGLVTTVREPIIRQSTVLAFEKCPRYGAFRRFFGLRPVARSAGRDESSFMHIGMKHLARGSSLTETAKALMAVYQSLLDEYRDINKCSAPVEFEQEQTQVMNVGYACAKHLWSKIESAQSKGLMRVVGVETPFDVMLDVQVLDTRGVTKTVTVRAQGQHDMVMLRTETDPLTNKTVNLLMPWDNKAIAPPPSQWTLPADLRMQAHLYVNAARMQLRRSEFPGVPSDTTCDHFLYGVIRKPSCRRKKLGKPDEQPLDDYLAECEEQWSGTGRWEKRATDIKSDPPVMLRRVHVGQTWDSCQAGRIAEAIRYMQYPPFLHLFPPHEASCQFGFIKCEMLPICSRPCSQWNRAVANDYVQSSDPLDSVEDRTV